MFTISVRVSVIVATLTLSLASDASGQSCTYGPFTSGFDQTELTWCVSGTGTLQYLETPSFTEHLTFGLLLEGYAVCSSLTPEFGNDIVNGWDSGGPTGASAWGATTASGLSGSGVTIARTTADGRLRLTMKFSHDTTNRVVNIATTVRNLTAAKLYHVVVTRFADIDAGEEATNNLFVNTRNTVTAVNPAISRGLELNTKNVKANHEAVIINPFDPVNHGSCAANTESQPITGDFGAKIFHLLGDLAAGASKTVTFRYREP